MRYRYLLCLLLCLAPSGAEVLIGPTIGNGGFVSSTSGFNGSPDSWIASSGVWIDSGNSSLSNAPFGADNASGSRFIQIHADGGETLTSATNFTVDPGDVIQLSLDYKTGGSGATPTLQVQLWDSSTLTVHATLGTIASTTQATFTTRTFTHNVTTASTRLRLRFVLPAAGGLGRDVHLDRIHLSGGTITRPEPPAPINYDTTQVLLPEDSDARIIEKAAKLLPRPAQVAWQRLETTFFIHYGPNAFTGVEWGTGMESPAVFQPTAFDAGQWVSEIHNAGGKLVMLVVKHHDGFCLWPSRYTGHDVASSPWLNGQGNVVRAVADECAARGIKFGIYLSPADLYQIESSPGLGSGLYGNGSATQASLIPTAPAAFSSAPTTTRTPPAGSPVLSYSVDDYNRYFLNQLYELLTEYGQITEVWFDGANPKQTNPPQLYDRTAWFDLIRTLQPEAMIAIKGPDVRWVGNEEGHARETEWSPLPIPNSPANHDWSDMMANDLGSRARLTRGSHLTWYPAEADVPILNGWFWNSSKSPKSVSTLIDIHYESIGRNANLLLNLSPDNRGLIPENQLAPLRSMAQVIRNTFATDLAQGTTGAPGELLDNNPDTFTEAPEGQSTAEWTLDLPGLRTFDVVCLQEPIAQRGQRIEGFAVDIWNGSTWSQQANATTIGHKRLLRLASPVTTDRVRIRITACRLNPSLATVSLHKQAVSTAAPVIGTRTPAGLVSLSHPTGRPIRYTLDGSTPGPDSPLYSSPLSLPLGGNLRAVGIGTDGLAGVEASRLFPDLASGGWSATADQEVQPAALAIDGDPATAWSATNNATPHWLRVDMGSPRWIGGFTYLPPSGGGPGTVTSYRFETSNNGIDWINTIEGTFGNMTNNPVRQDVTFDPIKTRWFRLSVLGDVSSGTTARVAEISVIAAGFDAWKRDLGQAALQPEDPWTDGKSAFSEYVFGEKGGIFSVGRPDEDSLSMVIRTRAGLPDVSAIVEISDDLANWTTPPGASILEVSSSAEWEETRWSVDLPVEWSTGFARGSISPR